MLRPGGTFAFLEHGLSPDPGVARWQRRLDPVQRRVAGGCHLSRDVLALVSDSGLDVEQSDSATSPARGSAAPGLHHPRPGPTDATCGSLGHGSGPSTVTRRGTVVEEVGWRPLNPARHVVEEVGPVS